MANIFISPGKYAQGTGELKKIGEYTKVYGEKALVVITENGRKRCGQLILESFGESGILCAFEYFNGECSTNEINRLGETLESQKCDVIIGVGGGKIFDTVKAAAYNAKIPVIICPTVASTDAPCSALSVIYTEEGVFEKYLFLPSNPNLVLVDTEIIAQSPMRLTIAGMGDALATYFEARACANSNSATCAGGKTTNAALTLAKLCFDTLMQEGLKAKSALRAKVNTQAVDKIIEANTLLSGIGFESGGLAAAHAIHNGFTVLDECHCKYHGEKVAFGTIVQLILENVPKDELDEVAIWCMELGLPITLAELGIEEVTEEKIMAVANAACAESDTMHNMPFEVDAKMVYNAILAADAYGKTLVGM